MERFEKDPEEKHAFSDELHERVRDTFGPQFAVLDESGNPVEAKLLEWAVFFERNGGQRIILRDRIEEYTVSTVFTGINQNYMPGANPIWFETMVFGPRCKRMILGRDRESWGDELWQDRARTREEAEACHRQGIRWLEDYLANRGRGCDCEAGSPPLDQPPSRLP
jgi:hypothetical protein